MFVWCVHKCVLAVPEAEYVPVVICSLKQLLVGRMRPKTVVDVEQRSVVQTIDIPAVCRNRVERMVAKLEKDHAVTIRFLGSNLGTKVDLVSVGGSAPGVTAVAAAFAAVRGCSVNAEYAVRVRRACHVRRPCV